jgi:hypothetical protein
MTDNVAPPVVTRNVRAELARAGRSPTEARNHLEMSATTWTTRMAAPGTWRLQELERLAEWLGVNTSELVAG